MRFRPPMDPEPWTSPQEAFTPGASSPQILRPAHRDPYYAWYSGVEQMDEDCLFLNLYTPALDDRPRPVMVWVHGGGWRDFSGNGPGFNGSRLAAAENVVVVSLTHRLGVLGHLALPDAEFAGSANLGLLDLLHALKWIRHNIASFGGDPGNVTLFGQSGGASKIVALASLPASRGYFHKLIVQSSGGGLSLADRAEAETAALRLREALGDGGRSAEALQRIPADRLLQAADRIPFMFRGTRDGTVLPGEPLLPRPDGTVPAAGVPMLVGVTAEEASYGFHPYPEILDLGAQSLHRRLANALALGSAEAERIQRLYAETHPHLTPGEMLIKVISDYQYTSTNLALADRQTLNAPGRVYAYRFDYPAACEERRWGAPHTSEIPYVFGTLQEASAMIGAAPDHAAISRQMMRIWACFARNGRPTGPAGIEWAPYDPKRANAVAIDRTTRGIDLADDPALAAIRALPPVGYSLASRNLLRD